MAAAVPLGTLPSDLGGLVERGERVNADVRAEFLREAPEIHPEPRAGRVCADPERRTVDDELACHRPLRIHHATADPRDAGQLLVDYSYAARLPKWI